LQFRWADLDILNGTVPDGGWQTGQDYHIKVERYDGVIYLGLDGVTLASVANTRNMSYAYQTNVGGNTIAFPNNFSMDGWMSNVRFTPTVARTNGASTWTVPTELFPITVPVLSSLLQFDGNYTDDGTEGATWVATGDAAIDATYKKFGTGSMITLTTGNLKTSDLPAFGTGDFFVRGWVLGGASSAVRGMFDCRPAAGTGTSGFTLYNTSNNALSMYTNGAVQCAAPNVKNSQWNYFEYSRVDGVGYIFVNGLLGGTYTDTNNYTVNDEGYNWGSLMVGGANANAGYLDALEIAYEGGHTAGYAVPTTAPPTP